MSKYNPLLVGIYNPDPINRGFAIRFFFKFPQLPLLCCNPSFKSIIMKIFSLYTSNFKNVIFICCKEEGDTGSAGEQPASNILV